MLRIFKEFYRILRNFNVSNLVPTIPKERLEYLESKIGDSAAKFAKATVSEFQY